jgi:hypothetical protein
MFYTNSKEAYSDYINLTKNNNIKQYMNSFISMNQIYFVDFNLYTPFNLFYYEDNIAPSIDMIINFIKNNNMTNIQKSCYSTFNEFKIENYFNPISHHLFITPYLMDNNYGFELNNIKYIESMMNVINKNINGIWYINNNINLKKIDPVLFINLSNMMIKFYQDNFIDRFFIDNNKLLL